MIKFWKWNMSIKFPCHIFEKSYLPSSLSWVLNRYVLDLTTQTTTIHYRKVNSKTEDNLGCWIISTKSSLYTSDWLLSITAGLQERKIASNFGNHFIFGSFKTAWPLIAVWLWVLVWASFYWLTKLRRMISAINFFSLLHFPLKKSMHI